MEADRVYRSRVDAWLVLTILGATTIPVAAAAWLISHGEFTGVALLATWGSAVTAGIISISFPLRYTLARDAVHIRSGWLRWEVPYAELRHVRPTWNPLASPAWSLRRVRLETAGIVILVSPDDRESFISDLAQRCPHLLRDGDRLEARPRSR